MLPNNFKQIIAGKSWLLRAEPFLQKVRDASAYLVRVTFGTALITSVILVWVTIVAILSSSGKDDDRRLVPSQAHRWSSHAMCAIVLLHAPFVVELALHCRTICAVIALPD